MSTARLASIDCLRGLAVVCMVLWHVVDAWQLGAGRDTAGFALVVFFGGWAAPMFLFLAGLSVAFAAERRVGRAVTRAEAGRRVRRRGWQILLLAHLFRLQSFLLNPNAAWDSLFKSDILNVLGLGIVLAGWCWPRADSPRRRRAWLLVPALVGFGVLAPWAPDWQWPSMLPWRLEGYVRVRDGNAVFSLFPAVGYVLAGAFAGSSRSVTRAAAGHGPSCMRLAAAGAGMALMALVAQELASGDGPAWTTPLAVGTLRVGAMLATLGGIGWLLREPRLLQGPLVTLGQTSLFVYWVHVELAYGVFSAPWHRSLTLTGALVGWLLMMVGLWAGAIWWRRVKPERPLIPAHLRADRASGSSRCAGDRGISAASQTMPEPGLAEEPDTGRKVVSPALS